MRSPPACWSREMVRQRLAGLRVAFQGAYLIDRAQIARAQRRTGRGRRVQFGSAICENDAKVALLANADPRRSEIQCLQTRAAENRADSLRRFSGKRSR